MTRPLPAAMEFDTSGTLVERCGFRVFCGRPPGHRGQHGGWRTHIRVAVPGGHDLDAPLHPSGAELGPAEVTALAEVVEHGTMAEAARCLGRSAQTIKNQISVVHQKAGTATTLEALRQLGWIRLPTGAGHR